MLCGISLGDDPAVREAQEEHVLEAEVLAQLLQVRDIVTYLIRTGI
jgi:hypothetical protein